MGDRYYRPPGRGSHRRVPSSSPPGSRPYDAYRPGHQGRGYQDRSSPQPPRRSYGDSPNWDYPRHSTPGVQNRGRPHPPEDRHPRVRDLPRDHPLMLEMERFKDDRHKRKLRWINFARHLGEEWDQAHSYDRLRFHEEEQKAENRLQDLAAMIALERRGMLEEDPEYGRERPLYRPPPPRYRNNGRPPKAVKATGPWTKKKAAVSVENWMKKNNSLALEKDKEKPKPQVPIIIGDDGSDDGIPDDESLREAPLPLSLREAPLPLSLREAPLPLSLREAPLPLVEEGPDLQPGGTSKTSGLQGSGELNTTMQRAKVAISGTTMRPTERTIPHPAMDPDRLELLIPANRIESSGTAPMPPVIPSVNLGEHRMETADDDLSHLSPNAPSGNLGKHRMDVEDDVLLEFSAKRRDRDSHAGVVGEHVNYAASTSPAEQATSTNIPYRQGSNSFDLAASLRDAKRQADAIALGQPPSSSQVRYGHQRGGEENTSMAAVTSLQPTSSIDWEQLWSALQK